MSRSYLPVLVLVTLLTQSQDDIGSTNVAEIPIPQLSTWLLLFPTPNMLVTFSTNLNSSSSMVLAMSLS